MKVITSGSNGVIGLYVGHVNTNAPTFLQKFLESTQNKSRTHLAKHVTLESQNLLLVPLVIFVINLLGMFEKRQ